ncbi:hypothetical protein KAH37_07630 [bacterium]|nr:hypothetical protein [bacterium]
MSSVWVVMVDAYGMSNMELIAEIGRRLRKKRLNKNLSQKKLVTTSQIKSIGKVHLL